MNITNNDIKYMYMGYRKRLHDSLLFIMDFLGEDKFFVYKGAAINLITEPTEEYIRTFRDIDIWISPSSMERALRSEKYHKGKFTIIDNYYGIECKSVLDVKSSSYVENIVPVDLVLDNLTTTLLDDVKVNIPTVEMMLILTLAHEKKHREKKDFRENFVNDCKFLLSKIQDYEFVINNVRTMGMLSELQEVCKIQGCT